MDQGLATGILLAVRKWSLPETFLNHSYLVKLQLILHKASPLLKDASKKPPTPPFLQNTPTTKWTGVAS